MKEMKKKFFAFIAGSIFTLAVTNGAIAQTSNKVKLFESEKNVVIPYKLMPVRDKTKSIDGINTKALKNFGKNYKDASDVKWLKNDHTITVQFPSNGIYTVVYYDTKGHWQGSLKNYHEDKFDLKVRDVVKSKYYDYKIDWVQEIETVYTYGVPTYLIYIEDNSNFKVIRVSDGVMDVYEQFKKQQ